MEYNITFTLGDPSGDGHASTSEYHLICTHSTEDIENAYKKFIDEFGFDYVKDIGNDYEPSTILTEKEAKILVSIGAIPIEFVEDDGSYYFSDLEKEYIDIFAGIINHYIPNFNWKERDLQESELHLLRGAAYGFAYHGE